MFSEILTAIPWWAYGIIILVFVVMAITPKKASEKQPKLNLDNLPYTKKALLSKAEYNFFRAMQFYCPGMIICPKVGLIDILDPPRGKEYMKYFGHLGKKHVDFLLVHPESMEIICAVELDDKSHQKDKAKQNDDFKNAAFKASGIPLIRIQAKEAYTAEDFTNIRPTQAAS